MFSPDAWAVTAQLGVQCAVRFVSEKMLTLLLLLGLGRRTLCGLCVSARSAFKVLRCRFEFGHKSNDLIAATAAILPCAHDDDNGAIVSGKLIETERDPDNGDGIIVDVASAGTETPRLGNNLLGATFNQPSGTGNVLGSTLVIEAN